VLLLNGYDLSLPNLVAAARAPGPVGLHVDALERMRVNRLFAERIAERGDDVYGLTTGVGVRKNRAVSADEMRQFNARMVREHATGQGPALPADVVRATTILLLNQLAAGRSNVRPEIAELIAQRLTDGVEDIIVPVYGATGMGDVAPLSHLVLGLLGDVELEAGEALPLIGQGSYVTAHAALALYDAEILLETLVTLAALDLEAYAANPSPFHPAAGEVRPYPGYRRALASIGHLLGGSQLGDDPRHLHAPLSFRDAGPVLGAAYDTFAFCIRQLSIELNAHQQNPLALMEEDRMLPVANFDVQALAAALDFARIALAPCLTAQNERSIKLLQASETGLTDGLEPYGADPGHSLSELAWPLQALTVEARLLIQPVSAELGSSSQAEKIEDRLTMAGLGARRLAEMSELGFRAAAIACVIACQAIDLRGLDRLGPTMASIHGAVRRHVPPLGPGDPPPNELEPLIAALRGGLLA
jgi:histidine ammonia-lyase